MARRLNSLAIWPIRALLSLHCPRYTAAGPMTSASSTNAAPTVGTEARGGWLYGPSIDLLLGAGVGYLISIPLLFLLSSAAGLGTW